MTLLKNTILYFAEMMSDRNYEKYEIAPVLALRMSVDTHRRSEFQGEGEVFSGTFHGLQSH